MNGQMMSGNLAFFVPKMAKDAGKSRVFGRSGGG